jgi:Fe-Mn family superoxide dismutase
VELHHGTHHAGYVKTTNLTMTLLEEAREAGDLTRLPALKHALAFNLSGHILHSLLWKNMTPNGGDRPDGTLARAIDEHFGSFEKFSLELTEVASTLMGSGWAALIWEPIGRRLLTTQIYDHQSNISPGGVPLMVIDAWEHAYYLQYGSQKAAFFAAVWHLWNWNDVAKRLAAAQRLDLLLPGGAGA